MRRNWLSPIAKTSMMTVRASGTWAFVSPAPRAKDRLTMMRSSPVSWTALTITRYRPLQGQHAIDDGGENERVDHREGARLGRE